MIYKDMHLTDSRRYARRIGVKRPTSYNKNVLIEKILEIEKGWVEPSFQKMGRPTKGSGELVIENLNQTETLLYVIKRTRAFLMELEKELIERKKEQTE